MIHIILGDDIVVSRQQFLKLKEEYETAGYEIVKLDKVNLFELDKWLDQSSSLFSDKKVFFGENLLSKKENKKGLAKYDRQDSQIDIVIWEETLEGRIAKFIFEHSKIHASKLPHNIFKLMDTIYPGNLPSAVALLKAVFATINEHMILVMLQKRMRDLILVKDGLKPEKKLADWQLARLKEQTKKWPANKLILFYDALYRVEVMAKTNSHYYSVKKALDITLCYFL